MSNSDLNIILKIKELQQEAEDYLSIVFERPRNFIYTPGNWMDIRFPTPEFPVGKTYSFASSPTESDLIITFKKGVSKFKKALEQVKPGDTMLITQYGSNGFLLNKRFQSVFIAGGVGITPFRSMIKEVIDTNQNLELSLIYLNQTDDFPFKTEFDRWNIHPHYIVTSVDREQTKQKVKQILNSYLIQRPHFYIAGPPGMVTTYENMLLGLGVRDEMILIDKFDGY